MSNRLPTTNEKTKELVERELAYINTKHPDFHKEEIMKTFIKPYIENPLNAVGDAVMELMARHKLSPLQQRECEVTQKLIKSYFLIIRKSIQDTVPKTIMLFMVNFVKNNLLSELMTHLYKQEQFDNLLQESEHIAIKRREASEMLKVMNFIIFIFLLNCFN